MPALSILIKPASSNCNLRCKYCFYRSIAENRDTESYGVMSLDTLESLVKRAFEYAEETCTFAFQGGEPTISGLDFYIKFVEMVEIYNTRKIKVNYALQTNGMVIDEKWAAFLAREDFLVGLSLDGPKNIHNLNRIDGKGEGTFNRVMRTVQLFNKFQVKYNILYVVTSQSTKHAMQIYNFFKQNRFGYIQFISCLDPLNEEKGNHPYSLKADDYYNFLKVTFDLWYEDLTKGNYVSVRYFDNLVSMMLGYKPEACGMNGKCQCQCVVEADGGVYPCDFYVLDEWHLGNIKEKNLKDILTSEVGDKFVQASLDKPEQCKNCKWYGLCRGGCRREREDFANNVLEINYYCSAYKRFFDYAYTRLLEVAKMAGDSRA